MRWKILLDAVGIPIPLSHAFNLMMVGSFYGLITPGKIGEFGRVFHLSEKKSISIATVVVEKAMDIAILIILSLLTTILFFRENLPLLVFMGLCGIGGIIVFILSLNGPFLIKIGQFVHLDPSMINQYLVFFNMIIKDSSLMLRSLVLTISYYGVSYVIGVIIAISAGFPPLSVISLPIIILIGNIPLTISGIGIRESVGSMIFVVLGESPADGFVYSLLLFLLITVVPGIWGYILTMKGVHTK